MAHPVTTTDILLSQVVDLLTEVRDLLQPEPDAPAEESSAAAPQRSAAPRKAAAKQPAKKSSPTKK